MKMQFLWEKRDRFSKQDRLEGLKGGGSVKLTPLIIGNFWESELILLYVLLPETYMANILKKQTHNKKYFNTFLKRFGVHQSFGSINCTNYTKKTPPPSEKT